MNFFMKQDPKKRDVYIALLEVTGSLSRLFAESTDPFLYYRAMENVFCKAFDATNLSRSDVSADAGKNGIGIGLKTFLQNNGKTFQKIAEFNKESYLLRNLKELDLIRKVSHMRNERIRSTMRICNLKDMMYHLVTRSKRYMAIYEEHMDLIDIENLKITGSSKTTIHFTDEIHEYSYSLSKSTLLKRFDTRESKKIFGFNVDILEDPYDLLLSIKEDGSIYDVNFKGIMGSCDEIVDYVILPLYSARSNRVEEHSGLNQWNASGRKRDEDEVYIPIPSWIHRAKHDFFVYNTKDNKTDAFEVTLPNGKVLSMKVAQQGGKALMSNPNSDLGKWILREILELRPKTLVTKEQLDMIGIDSIKLSKRRDGGFSLDFLKSGSYEEYYQQYKDRGEITAKEEK